MIPFDYEEYAAAFADALVEMADDERRGREYGATPADTDNRFLAANTSVWAPSLDGFCGRRALARVSAAVDAWDARRADRMAEYARRDRERAAGRTP